MIKIVANKPLKTKYEGPYPKPYLQKDLLDTVTKLSIPRHYKEESENNTRIFQFILDWFLEFGYQTRVIGLDRNIIAFNKFLNRFDGPYTLVGAHYDSVPETPGADDNASAVAAMLHAAFALPRDARSDYQGKRERIIFAAFNQEEDGLLGSRTVVEQLLSEHIDIKEVHILEMVGFTSEKQTLPPEVPVELPREKGDFLALISDPKSNKVCEKLVKVAETCNLPAIGFQTFVPPQALPGVFHRSDHSPFWMKNIPAIMWTDTSEYRSPHYHQITDTPETLDYDFLARVTQTLTRYLERSG
jgi:Zn-dependent M28 family amino/carboxypeptidase